MAVIDTTTGVLYLKGSITGPVTIGSGQLLLPDGTAAAPSLAFASDTDTGLRWLGSGQFYFVTNGSGVAYFDGSTFKQTPNANTGTAAVSAHTITQTWNTTGAPTLFLANVTDTASDAASLLMDLQVGSASKFKVSKGGVGTFGNSVVSGGNVFSGGYFSISSKMYLTAVSDGNAHVANASNTGLVSFSFGPSTGNTTRGSSVWTNGLTTIDMATATGTGTGTITSPTTAIPANSYVVGMTCKVTTILAGAGLTTISIGDGTDPDKWGTGIAIAAGTTVNFGAHTAGPSYYGSATSIVITADAGVLSTGVISCSPIIISATPIGS